MHLEVLVEDLSGKKCLETLLPRVTGSEEHTFRIHAYRGIGRIPKGMRDTKNASRRIMLDSLPKLLRGYGRTFGSEMKAAVIVVLDLDDKDLRTLLQELHNVLDTCNPPPITRFCIAIEEGEAWLLGDLFAVKSAYPNANDAILNSYVNDSICGTWETLANAVYDGGEKALRAKGAQAVGIEKSRWAENICPNMDVEQNISPSFRFFLNSVRELLRKS